MQTINFDDLPDGLLLKLDETNSEAYEGKCEYKNCLDGRDISYVEDCDCPDCGHHSHADEPVCGHRTFNVGSGENGGDIICSCKGKLTTFRKCPRCHGTGHVRKRVVGAVEIQHSIIGVNVPGVRTIGGEYNIGDNGPCEGETYDFKKLDDALIHTIIAAYRDGTLPKAARDGLQEITVEEDGDG